MVKIMDKFGVPINTVAAFQAAGNDYMAFHVEQDDRFRVRACDLGNGHLEVSASRLSKMRECDWPRHELVAFLEYAEMAAERDADEIAERKRERSLKNAANRAYVRVRRLCKVMGADTLLTLTYKGLQDDLALAKRHLKEFNRRMEKVIPGFKFVATFEKQKRGAWHVHMAVERIPAYLNEGKRPGSAGVRVKSFDVIRAVWRSVAKEWGGNIDMAMRKRSSQRSAARIAGYISKYILKAYAEGEAFQNRWTKYGDFDAPKPVHMGDVANLHEAIVVVFGFLAQAHEIVVSKLDRWKDFFVLHAERPAPR